jgi:hypothetical protein
MLRSLGQPRSAPDYSDEGGADGHCDLDIDDTRARIRACRERV